MSYTVLVAASDFVSRALLHLHLERAGYRVMLVRDGFEAVEQASSSAPSLLLLDDNLPFFSSDEVGLALQRNALTARIPIILMTGHPRRPAQMAANVVAVVAKPAQPRTLLPLIHAALQAVAVRATA